MWQSSCRQIPGLTANTAASIIADKNYVDFIGTDCDFNFIASDNYALSSDLLSEY